MLVVAALLKVRWVLTKKNLSSLTVAPQLCAAMNTINAFIDRGIGEDSAAESVLLSLTNELVLGVSEDRTVECVCLPGSDILIRDSCGALHSLNFFWVFVAENVRVLVRSS